MAQYARPTISGCEDARYDVDKQMAPRVLLTNASLANINLGAESSKEEYHDRAPG